MPRTTKLPKGLGRIDPGRLREADQPWRRIDGERYEDLKHNLRQRPEMLEARPVIADRDGNVIAGRHRLRASIDLLDEPGRFRRRYGKTGLPAYVRDFTPAERREWALGDNADFAFTVRDEVAEVVRAHSDADADLRLLGLGQGEIDDHLGRTADPDFSPSGPGPRLDELVGTGRNGREGRCPTCGRTYDD